MQISLDKKTCGGYKLKYPLRYVKIILNCSTSDDHTQSKNPNIALEYEWEVSILIDNWSCSINTYRYFIKSILPITIKFNLTILKLLCPLVPAGVKPAFPELLKLHLEALIIYTDPSHSNNFVGCAATTNSEIILQYNLPPHFTILAVELYAIYLAIQHIAAWSQEPQTLILISDALSSLNTLQNRRHRHQHPSAKLIVRALSNMEHTEAVILILCKKPLTFRRKISISSEMA